MKPFPSRYKGFCSLCQEPIQMGDLIVKEDGQWVHHECPPEPGETSFPVTDETRREAQGRPAWAETLKGAVASVETALAAPVAFIQPSSELPTDNLTFSSYQWAIFEEVAWGQGNLVGEAYAGSGKTTTEKHAVRYVPVNVAYRKGLLSQSDLRLDYPLDEQTVASLMADVSVAFCAFNKSIADTLKAVMPSWARTGTVHSLCFSNVRRAFPGVKVEDRKLDWIMDEFSELTSHKGDPTDERIAKKLLRGNMRKLVSLAKAVLVNYEKPAAVLQMAGRYGLELNGDEEILVRLLPDVMSRCALRVDVIDFDDMIWFCIHHELVMEQFDYLFVDECQDLNKSQIEALMCSVKPSGRVIAVGDRFQSLYGFRGADTDAIPNLIKRLDAKVLPLSITYRCPASHVRRAQDIVPQIQPRPNAPEGLIETINEDKVASLARQGDMIVCRTNAPLVPLAFQLIRQGVKAVIRGRDIGKGLTDQVQRFQAPTVDILYSRLNEYQQRETARLVATDRLTQLMALEDRCETLFAIMADCQTVQEVVAKLETIFSDDVKGVVLSSVHRAKGLEAERVFILRPDLMPHPRAKQAWEQQQERNCLYVALTRSKSEMYFVEATDGR